MKRRVPILVCLVLCLPLAARAANWPDRPTLTAVRAAQRPVIDGDLSDPAWAAAPEFTDFTQHDPNDGDPATLRTSFRILYDDEAVYFGAYMHDTAPPTALLARRDTFIQSDFLSINIDPQHDRLSGAAFTVTPSNMQIDSILYNDIGEDGSWDAVWDSVAKVVDDGWVAEVRVPYSQLRFPEKPVHVWGINVTRRTTRLNEWVRIVNTRKGETGFVSHFADVVGIEGIRRGRSFEIAPYVVGRGDVFTRNANPLRDRYDHRLDGGLDLKYALTSTLTLTGTVNPDFGQVEVDPAVVNLTEFETFYPEKRPFFTEGLNIFAFGDSPARTHFSFFFAPRMFYSRRIGRAPQGGIDGFSVVPGETTILGAAKVTGKIGDWSIGVLDALTDSEHGLTFGGHEPVEPMANYFVSRVTKEYGEASRLGFLLTSVNRRLPDELSYLREDSVSGGVDGYTSFRDRSWIFEWVASGSHVSGSEQAIALTQTSPARYYNRPDAGAVDFDPTRTSLSGFAGRAMVSKQTGRWRPNVQIQAYSPGFETNDAGFMQRTDLISSHALVHYANETTTKTFRERNTYFGVWQNQNFDGDTLERGVFADFFGTLQSYWNYRAALFLTPGAFDDRLTRGGPVVRREAGWSSDLVLGSDNRKRFYFELEGHLEDSDDGSYVRTGSVALNFRPSPSLVLSVVPVYSRSYTYSQFVLSAPDPSMVDTYGSRYVFGELDQRSFELGTRADWTLSSRLSFQLYVQPFIAAGDFHDYHVLARARSADYTPYEGTVNDPDFNFRSVRGSAVVRWEFRPGSALYVVWNENRADEVPLGDFSFNRDLRAISTAPSHDVFLVKLSYWLPL
ncbi:MAG TPA: DUF5916 domain-containing protein [Thermoanaerobaculia bacterium]|nr:DUF5916 domain-containing protein [Thermoanaerobaculia bacterium]